MAGKVVLNLCCWNTAFVSIYIESNRQLYYSWRKRSKSSWTQPVRSSCLLIQLVTFWLFNNFLICTSPIMIALIFKALIWGSDFVMEWKHFKFLLNCLKWCFSRSVIKRTYKKQNAKYFITISIFWRPLVRSTKFCWSFIDSKKCTTETECCFSKNHKGSILVNTMVNQWYLLRLDLVNIYELFFLRSDRFQWIFSRKCLK